MKKYKILISSKLIVSPDLTLFRIKAMTSFGGVTKGDVGGFIEKESNLSFDGDAWVYGNARVYGDAWVCGNAWVYGDARVYGNAQVYGDAQVQFGELKIRYGKEIKTDIAVSLGSLAVGGKYLFYKRVNRTKTKGVYSSCRDESFLYKTGKISRVIKPNDDKLVSCGAGIHVSTPFYGSSGDTLIAVEVKVKDIITCLGDKVRVRKVKVLGEVDEL